MLLRGVNDDATVLCELSEALYQQGVLPYYLHLPDHVAGTAHFFVSDQTGQRLHQQMQSTLPGYLVPRLVRELPGRPGKTILSPQADDTEG